MAVILHSRMVFAWCIIDPINRLYADETRAKEAGKKFGVNAVSFEQGIKAQQSSEALLFFTTHCRSTRTASYFAFG